MKFSNREKSLYSLCLDYSCFPFSTLLYNLFIHVTFDNFVVWFIIPQVIIGKLSLLLVFTYMILHYSSQSLFRHSFHEFRFRLWGVLVHHQRGMYRGMYHPTQLAKWRQVLLYVFNYFHGSICIAFMTELFFVFFYNTKNHFLKNDLD